MDAVNNKIIWLRDATALIPFTNQDPLKSPDALFKIRPNLVSANLDGTGMVNLDENITSILGKFDAQSLSLPIIGGMEMNPITKKVYVGLEYSYFSSNKVIKDYKGNVTNMPGVNSMLSRYTTVEVDYNGKNPKNLLVEGVTQLAYPKAYNTLPVIGVDNGGLYWSNHATRAKSIALNNFILGNLELNNN